MNNISSELIGEIVECAKKYGVEKECYCAILQTKELFDEANPRYDILMDKLNISDPNIVDYVISPADKKLFKYTERNAVERLFSENRCNLLKEVGEWNP